MRSLVVLLTLITITSCADRTTQRIMSNKQHSTVELAINFVDSVFISRRGGLPYGRHTGSTYYLVPLLSFATEIPPKDSITGNPSALSLLFDNEPECNSDTRVIQLLRDAPCDTALAIGYNVLSGGSVKKIAVYRNAVVDITGSDPSVQKSYMDRVRILRKVSDRGGTALRIRNIPFTKVEYFTIENGHVWGVNNRGKVRPFKKSFEDDIYVK